jgi:hypothetical protein
MQVKLSRKMFGARVRWAPADDAAPLEDLLKGLPKSDGEGTQVWLRPPHCMWSCARRLHIARWKLQIVLNFQAWRPVLPAAGERHCAPCMACSLVAEVAAIWSSNAKRQAQRIGRMHELRCPSCAGHGPGGRARCEGGALTDGARIHGRIDFGIAVSTAAFLILSGTLLRCC